MTSIEYIEKGGFLSIEAAFRSRPTRKFLDRLLETALPARKPVEPEGWASVVGIRHDLIRRESENALLPLVSILGSTWGHGRVPPRAVHHEELCGSQEFKNAVLIALLEPLELLLGQCPPEAFRERWIKSALQTYLMVQDIRDAERLRPSVSKRSDASSSFCTDTGVANQRYRFPPSQPGKKALIRESAGEFVLYIGYAQEGGKGWWQVCRKGWPIGDEPT